MNIPSPVPIVDVVGGAIADGDVIPISAFCAKAFRDDPKCADHYQSLLGKSDAYFECPYGFTTRTFRFEGGVYALTGFIGHPRFNSERERVLSKKFPEHKISRQFLESCMKFIRQTEILRADAIKSAAQVLPQAFHELRKYNGAVLQHAEKQVSDHGETPNLTTIISASELMRNNFDILEALSNLEVMRALPNDDTIHLFDLVFKVMKVLKPKAQKAQVTINVAGVAALIRGSQKSFPIVPAVLLENAIKYGVKGQNIQADVKVSGGDAVLIVENRFDGQIDPERCFERGVRFSQTVEGAGFGLYLAQEIVSCHGGLISCEVADKVVRMTVKMPLFKLLPPPPRRIGS